VVRTALEIGSRAVHAFHGSDALLHSSFGLVEEQYRVRGNGVCKSTSGAGSTKKKLHSKNNFSHFLICAPKKEL
jgi:hypothetical protein